MTLRRRLACLLLAAPLALAACSQDDADEGALSGEPIAAIPAPDGQNWTDMAVDTEMGGVLLGNPDAPLKLVEYASHTCSHCADFSGEAHEALENYVGTGVVSFEIRNQIHDGIDLTFAMLARCGDASTFFPLATQGWANLGPIIATAQANGEALNAAMVAEDDARFQKIARESGLLDWFAARGISEDQSLACLADPSVAEAMIERSQTQSDEFEVTGTPTFFLNGRKLEGNSWATVEPALQEAGAR